MAVETGAAEVLVGATVVDATEVAVTALDDVGIVEVVTAAALLVTWTAELVAATEVEKSAGHDSSSVSVDVAAADVAAAEVVAAVVVVAGAADELTIVLATFVTAAADVVTLAVDVVAGAADKDEETVPSATGRNGSSASGSMDAMATPVEG